MIDSDIEELRAALAAVKPARWMHLFGDRSVYDRMEDGCRGMPMASVDCGPPTQKESKRLDYIAACHPERIARLLAALDQAQRQLVGVREYLTAAADGSMSRNNSEQLASELLSTMKATQ